MSQFETAAYVSTRQVGEATVSIISDGSFPWAPGLLALEADWRRAMPNANAAGEIELGLNFAHVKLGSSSILIDLAINDVASDDELPPRFTRQPGLVAGLASLRVTPDAITHVVITHAHGDHFAGATTRGSDGATVPRYPNARYFIGRAEWEENPSRDQPNSLHAVALGTLVRLDRMELVDGDREIAPGITMLHAPGESPGHSVVHVQSGQQSFVYLGDLVHHVCEVEHSDWVSPNRDRAAAMASRERIFAEAARRESTVVFTHRPFPGWGRIVKSGSGFSWENA